MPPERRERLSAAGSRALARSDVGAAVLLLERAAALLRADDPWRLELLIEIATALTERGRFERADELLRGVLEAAETAGDKRLRFRALVQRSQIELWRGSAVNEHRQLVEGAIRAFEEIGDELGLTRAWMLRSQMEWISGQAQSATASAERALCYAKRVGTLPEEEECVVNMIACGIHGPTPVNQVLNRCEMLLAERPGRRRFEGTVRAQLLSYLKAMQGHFDEARALYAQGQEMVAELGLELYASGLRLDGGTIEMLAGDVAAAEHELRRGYESLEAMGEKAVLSTIAALLAQALEMQGRAVEAVRFLEIADAAAAADDLFSQVLIRATNARLLAEREECQHAERLANEALKIAERTDFYFLRTEARLALADVLRAAGRKNEARRTIEAALAMQAAKGDIASAHRTTERLSELLGE